MYTGPQGQASKEMVKTLNVAGLWLAAAALLANGSGGPFVAAETADAAIEEYVPWLLRRHNSLVDHTIFVH